jgi:arylsulfatase A
VKEATAAEQAAHIQAHGFEEHRAFIGHTVQYGPPSPESDFLPHKLNLWACDFIARKALEPKPFYLQYSLGLVHWPLTPTPLNPDATTDNSSATELYAHMMQYMDDMVGNVLAAIDAAGIADNTVVVFGGDNGTWSRITSTYKDKEVRGGKLTTKDTGSWVPFYVRWPGVVVPGSTYSGLMDFSDIFPTFIEIAEAVIPDNRAIDGKSFLSQLKGRAEEHREYVFSMDRATRQFVRDKRWKLLIGNGLYDISNSPFEEILIPEEDQTPEQAEARRRLLGHYKQIVGNELPDSGDGQ